MLGLNIRRPKLAGFVARKENNASGLLRITFKHIALPPDFLPRPPGSARRSQSSRNPSLVNVAISGPRPYCKDIETFVLLFELPKTSGLGSPPQQIATSRISDCGFSYYHSVMPCHKCQSPQWGIPVALSVPPPRHAHP